MANVTADKDQSSNSESSNEQRRRSARRKWQYAVVLVPILFAILMLAALGIPLSVHRQFSANSDFGASLQLVESPKVESLESQSASGNSDSYATLAVVDLDLQRVKFGLELEQAKQIMRHLDFSKAQWNDLLQHTFDNEIGKRIAGDDQLLLRFIAIQNIYLKQVQDDLSDDATSSLKRVQLDSWNAMDNVVSIKQKIDEASEAKRLLLTAFKFNQGCIDQLQTIRESALAIPANETGLREAVARRKSGHDRDTKSAAAEAVLELKTKLGKTFDHLKQKRDSGAALLTGLKSQLARVEAGESLGTEVNSFPVASREEFEKDLKQIHTKLVAFTTPGYVQPKTADKLVYVQEKLPFSFSALQSIGALEDSERGRTILLRVAGSKSATQRNDRPLGSFPRMNSVTQLQNDPNVETRVREAQLLLRKYGSLMVEKGLLSK